MPQQMEIDLSGLKCPLPILRAKKALAKLASADQLTVITTDPGAPHDFAAFCHQTGHHLLAETALENGAYRLIIEHR